MRTRLALAACLIAQPLAALAANPGEYIVVGGLGGIECPRFVEAMAKSRTAGAASSEMDGFSMYVAGFQTAYNLQTPKTCDIFAGMNGDQLLVRLEEMCRAKPEQRFGAGVIALAKQLYPKRSKTCK